MALEATHIRFALDLQAVLEVNDVHAYVSGSIYPDSRYVTGVDRLLTHPKGYRDDSLYKATDFNKGWYVHLVADDVQQEVMREFLPETQETAAGSSEESWIRRSAVKILQDLDDARRFDLRANLVHLRYIENPNGEDLSRMRMYQDIFTDMYADIQALSIDVSIEMWKKFGVGEELCERMRNTAQSYAENSSTMNIIASMYAEMLARGRNIVTS